MKINPNTKTHGKAAAIEMLLELKLISDPGDNVHIHRAISRMTGKHHTSEKDWQSASATSFRRYFEGVLQAPPRSREGFVEILGHYVAMTADGFVPDPKSYRCCSARERMAHAREWLQRVKEVA